MGDDNFQYQYPRELDNQQLGATPREIVMKYFQYLPWFSISLAIMLIGAYLKLRYSPRVYQVVGNILVKDPSATQAGSDKFDNIFLMQPNKNLNDEIQVMRSRSMAARVVHTLGYETLYYNVGKIRTPSIVFPNESPIKLEILRLKDSASAFDFSIFIINDQEFSFTEKGQHMYFGQPFENNLGLFK